MPKYPRGANTKPRCLNLFHDASMALDTMVSKGYGHGAVVSMLIMAEVARREERARLIEQLKSEDVRQPVKA